MFTENPNKHVSPSARRATERPGEKSRAYDRNQWQTQDMYSGKQDVGTKKFVTRTQRDGGGYEERTETVSSSSKGLMSAVLQSYPEHILFNFFDRLLIMRLILNKYFF